MRGDWTRSIDWCFWNYPLIELGGKTMGIIGFGRIGQATAKIAVAFGMKVLAYDETKSRRLKPTTSNTQASTSFWPLPTFISLHCPLFDSTRGIINKNTIAQNERRVIVINTSRGPLVIEEDMLEALNSGKVYHFATDVVYAEPIPADCVLLGAKNCTITPQHRLGSQGIARQAHGHRP
jgi:glycerate dehydrogenase